MVKAYHGLFVSRLWPALKSVLGLYGLDYWQLCGIFYGHYTCHNGS